MKVKNRPSGRGGRAGSRGPPGKRKNAPKTRRDLRKEKRQAKKVKKQQHTLNKSHKGKREIQQQPVQPLQPNDNLDVDSDEVEGPMVKLVRKEKPKKSEGKLKKKIKTDEEKDSNDFRKEKNKLEADMQKQRVQQLLDANKEEDRNIRMLEKLMKMNKRKSKKLPKSFVDEGLDYLLEVCDEEKMSSMQKDPTLLESSDSEFENDLAEVTGKKGQKPIVDVEGENSEESGVEEEADEEEDLLGEEEGSLLGDEDEENILGDESEESEVENLEEEFKEEDLVQLSEGKKDKNKKRVKFEDDVEEENEIKKQKIEDEDFVEDDTWEDIYGRTRDKKGNVVQATAGKYIPPALRATSTNSVKLARLKRQMQGLLNRVAESNMASVASQMEQIIQANSRGDANEVLGQLLHALAPAGSITPPRMVAEHACLLALLHAHIGAEIGAPFLQSTVEKFDSAYVNHKEVEDKTLNNLLQMLCFMYCFKIFHCTLMFDILEMLSANFEEKDVELILLILKTVGPSLRKDDPAALKNVILNLQKQASSSKAENARVAFMLDVLMAIKNNNMSKIPDYDPDLVDRLKKLLRSLLRTGSSVSELKISMKDLLNAQQQGKWWVVGSAWQGAGPGEKSSASSSNSSQFSHKLLELARKQRMNTDLRRNIFCILMTAEDFIDAFDKLLHLGVKGQQEREIPYVILDCCLQEQNFNPYYAHLSQKFCDYDRKFKMSVQCSIWDKIKELNTLSKSVARNLASFTSFLVLNGGLTLAVLKVIEFSDLDKTHVRFVRQVLLSLLLAKKEQECIEAFTRVPTSAQLGLFREGMRLFLHRYILDSSQGSAESDLLKARVALAEKTLVNPDSKIKF